MITPKKLHGFQALLWLVAAVVGPLVLVLSPSHAKAGPAAGVLLCGILLAFAGLEWRRYGKTPEDAVFPDISKQPPAEQIRASKRAAWVLAVAGLVMGVWTYQSLSGPQPGPDEARSVWGVIAMVYDLLGFWPAVLFWPLLCLFGIGLVSFRVLKAKSMMRSKDAA